MGLGGVGGGQGIIVLFSSRIDHAEIVPFTIFSPKILRKLLRFLC